MGCFMGKYTVQAKLSALHFPARRQQVLDGMNRDGRLEQLKQRWLSDNTPR